MIDLKLVLARGSEVLHTIVDVDSGEDVYFWPVEVPGKGWSVAMVMGTKRTGKTIERAKGFDEIEDLTWDDALVAVDNLTRETIRTLNGKTHA